MNSFRYYFDTRKISGGQPAKENFVKTVFKDMIEIRNDGQGHDHLQEVFDAIWANTALRTSGIFDLSATAPKTPIEQFKDIVADLQNPFYNFIKVK